MAGEDRVVGEGLRIVALRPVHVGEFCRLVVDTLLEFGFAPDPVLDDDLDDPASAYEALWVAVVGDEVVGSAALRRLDPREVELKRMYLRPSFRGRGVGRRLLTTALEWAREREIEKVQLDTTEAMKAARHLYESHGFVRVAGTVPRQGQ